MQLLENVGQCASSQYARNEMESAIRYGLGDCIQLLFCNYNKKMPINDFVYGA